VRYRRRDTAYWTDQVVFASALCVAGCVWAVSQQNWKLAPTAAAGAFAFGWWAVSRADRGTTGQRWVWLAIQVAGVMVAAVVLVRTGGDGVWGYGVAVPVLVASWALAGYVLNLRPARRRVATTAAPVDARPTANADARDAFGRDD